MSKNIEFICESAKIKKKLDLMKSVTIKTKRVKFSIRNKAEALHVLQMQKNENDEFSVSFEINSDGIHIEEGSETVDLDSSTTFELDTKTKIAASDQFAQSSDVMTMTETIEKKDAQTSTDILPVANSDNPKCKICYDDAVDVAFAPCGHAVSCGKCDKKRRRGACFICGARIQNKMKLYF